ncbi:DNA-processing protein DprA [Candidatus Gracilibacteria bacterium]|nr:DNA-processing protein DprA [Candidatus Gracilibacteria bacterium]
MDLKFLLATHRALNLTPTRFQKLQLYFKDDWEKVFKAQITELQQAGLDPKGIEKFLTSRENIIPYKEKERVDKCGAQVLIYGQDNYPENLKNIPFPPVILFLRGHLQEEDCPCISVVGSRDISSYGEMAIQNIVAKIAQKGITIVSGLAIGADTLAHRMALEHGARTIAVLGSGIDDIYPVRNKELAENFLRYGQGAILSEYLPGTPIRPENFPLRNRIISGLSQATIVIEAKEKSGSLITAQTAIDQGKEVFAVPGSIFAENSKGTNQLILWGGVHPALSGEQILEQLGF